MRYVAGAAAKGVGQPGHGVAAPANQGALPGLRRGRAVAGASADANAKLHWLDRSALMQKPRRGAGASVDQRLSTSQIPVPLSATVFTAAPPPGVIFRVADLLPVEVGLNFTETVHFAPTTN